MVDEVRDLPLVYSPSAPRPGPREYQGPRMTRVDVERRIDSLDARIAAYTGDAAHFANLCILLAGYRAML